MRNEHDDNPPRATPPHQPSDALSDGCITVNGRRVIYWLLAVCVAAEILVVFLDATVNYARWSQFGMIRRLVNITREDSVSSWFAVTQTWMVAVTAWALCFFAHHGRRGKTVVIGWLLIAVFFSYMSLDDGSKMHERIGSAFKAANETEATSGGWGDAALEAFPSYSWQIVYMPFFFAFGVFMLVFLWRELELKWPRILVLVSLALLAGGVALDFVEGLEPEHPWNLYTILVDSFDISLDATMTRFDQMPYETLRHFSKSIEEFMEMLAHTILWAVFLIHLMRTTRAYSVRFANIPWTHSDSGGAR